MSTSVTAGVQEGKPYWGSVFRGVTDEKEWGMLKALDPLTGETKWDFRYYRALGREQFNGRRSDIRRG